MGCVYKISKGEFVYYGSTNNFERRMYDHRQCCNSEKSIAYNRKKYKIIREHGGWDAFTKEIVEEVDDINNLLQREDYWIRNNECVNERNATMTDQEKQAYYKQWRDDPINKANLNAYKKVYRDNPINKANNKAYQKEWYQLNKARRKERVQCECGSIGRRDTLNQTKHLNTKKHIKGVVKNLLDEYINQVLEIV
tara:strand:+ start:211 stop:795 length:585 start_codon:yes stop_codon:yes gene_type:complete